MHTRELKDKATQLFSKGKFVKAAEAYEQYCKTDPKDLQARLRMGDAWAKAGQKDRAITAYQAAAEGFARDGFLPRAIAASKLVLELDPSHRAVSQMLADLYAKKSGASRPTTSSTIGTKPSVTEAPVARPAVAEAVEISVDEEPPAAAPPPSIPVDAIDIEVESDAITGEVEVPIEAAAEEGVSGVTERHAEASPTAAPEGTPPVVGLEIELTPIELEPTGTSPASPSPPRAPPGFKPKQSAPAPVVQPPTSSPSSARIWLPPSVTVQGAGPRSAERITAISSRTDSARVSCAGMLYGRGVRPA